MVTAHTNSVSTVPNSALPDRFIANVQSHGPSVKGLLAKSISCEHVQEAFRWVSDLPTVAVFFVFMSNLVHGLSRMPISGAGGKLEVGENSWSGACPQESTCITLTRRP